MPDRPSPTLYRRVPLRTAPAKGSEHATFSNSPNSRLNARSPAEVRNGSNPRHTGSSVKMGCARRPLECHLEWAEFLASIPGSPRLQEAPLNQCSNGVIGGDPPVRTGPNARSTSRVTPHACPTCNIEEDSRLRRTQMQLGFSGRVRRG